MADPLLSPTYTLQTIFHFCIPKIDLAKPPKQNYNDLSGIMIFS
jgi:hypothetical protein